MNPEPHQDDDRRWVDAGASLTQALATGAPTDYIMATFSTSSGEEAGATRFRRQQPMSTT
jgi:hypothetical protein